MGLLDKLTGEGSLLTSLDGANGTPFDPTTKLNPNSLLGSTLDNANGATPPLSFSPGGVLNPNSLVGSVLDRDNGATPPKYTDSLPG